MVALKWFFTGMYSLMADEVADLAEGHFTAGVVALIGLLLVVHSQVLLQGRILSKRVAPLLTKYISNQKLCFNLPLERPVFVI